MSYESDELHEFLSRLRSIRSLFGLIDVVGHEIYNPLHKLKACAVLVLAYESDDTELSIAKRKALLQEIINLSDDIDKLITGMREIAKELESKNSDE